MGKLQKVYNIVWYGACESPDNECSELELADYADKIDFVFQVSDTLESGWKCWNSRLQSYTGVNDFETLVCGNPYIIKLKVNNIN